jgi:hypothetical protein
VVVGEEYIGNLDELKFFELCDGRIDAMVEMLKVQRSRCIVKY